MNLKPAKIAYWLIGTLVVLISTYHYAEVFKAYEHPGTFGIIVSWSMGIIFDLTGLLFLYYYTRIDNGWKHLLLAILLGFIFFLQFMYYTKMEVITLRSLLAGVWPYMIIVIAYLGRTVPGLSGKVEPEAKKQSKDDKLLAEIRERQGIKSEPTEKPEKKQNHEPEPAPQRKPRSSSRPRKNDELMALWNEEKQAYICPGCGVEKANYHQLNAHRFRECVEKNLKN